MKRSLGYTLIEILIVIFIISIVTSVALLNISRNENKHIETFANELTQIVMLAEEQAMLQPMVLGLSLREHAFQFLSLDPSVGTNKNNWLPFQNKILDKYIIPEDIQVGIEVGNDSASSEDEDTINPQIIISTNGDITPFTIYVGKKGERPRYAISGAADGKLTNKLLS